MKKGNHIHIIGGGIGGLFTAALLAKEGYKVTVLERCAHVGGGLQSFTRNGVTFDAGMHVVGGLQPGGSLNRICRHLGILDQLHCRPVDADCGDEDGDTASGTMSSSTKRTPSQLRSLALENQERSAERQVKF